MTTELNAKDCPYLAWITFWLIEPAEIARCLHSLKNNKTGGSDGLVGELLNYGGSGMVNLLHQLFSVVWHAELVPPQWREGPCLKRGIKRFQGYHIVKRCRKGFT